MKAFVTVTIPSLDDATFSLPPSWRGKIPVYVTGGWAIDDTSGDLLFEPLFHAPQTLVDIVSSAEEKNRLIRETVAAFLSTVGSPTQYVSPHDVHILGGFV